MSRDELIEVSRARYAKGEDIESLLKFLRSSGCSRIDSIAVIAKACNTGLAKAKELVHFSSAWNDRRTADEKFQENLIDAIQRWKSD